MLAKTLSFGLTPEQEAGFKQFSLETDIRQARIGVLLVIMSTVSFIFIDLLFIGAPNELSWLDILGIGLVLYSVLQVALMSRLRDYRAYQRSITIWSLTIVISVLIVNFTLQEDFIFQTVVVSMTVLLLYLVLPNRFPIQIALASAISAGTALIILISAELTVQTQFAILLSIGLANIIASSSSWQLHALRRRLFLNISEFSRSEIKAQRNRVTMEGVNRILREAVTSRTEEELGSVCLEVAEEATHSEFGFVGEIKREVGLIVLSISKPGWEGFSMIGPAGQKKVPLVFKEHGLYGRVLTDGIPLIANESSSHPDSVGIPPGNPLLKAFLGVPLKYKGRVVGMIGLGNKEGGYTEGDLRAIEEIAPTIVEAFQRKRAERALRESRQDLKQAQSVATTGSWRIKTDGSELLWSDESYRIFGIPKGTPMTYALFLGTVHPDDRDRVDQKWMAALRGEPYDIEHRIIVNGEVKWVREKAELEINANVALLSALGTVQDITDLKSAEENLKLRTEELARSNAELQQFAYVASHDLQEPLRMVVNYLSLLQRRFPEKLDPKAQEYIHFAVDGGERMRQLIDDLLEYSRVDTMGKDLAPTDMNAVVAKTLNILKVPIEEGNADIVVDPLPTVEADASQLEQVMQNLIGNALKFHGPERPRVLISVSPGTKEWIFSVKDNGIGLKMENVAKIFQMFQRLHTRGEYPGTGVGLAIVKKIIERHGGRIWVESEEGKGATFFFTISAKGVQRTRIG